MCGEADSGQTPAPPYQTVAEGTDSGRRSRREETLWRREEKEGGDRLVVEASAFLHDIHRIMQRELGRYCSPEESLPRVSEILGKVELSDEKVERILHCIKFHEEYVFSTNAY